MNKYVQALGIKFIFTAIVVFSLFGIFNHTSLWNLFLISATVAGLTYLGDVFILPRIGNLLAPILDFAGIFVLLWFLGNNLIETSTSVLLLSLTGAYLLSFCEAIFHIYMRERVHEQEEVAFPVYNSPQLQTEVSKELDPRSEVSKNISQNKQTDVDE